MQIQGEKRELTSNFALLRFFSAARDPAETQWRFHRRGTIGGEDTDTYEGVRRSVESY